MKQTLILFTLLLFGCTNKSKPKQVQGIYSTPYTELNTYLINGCEYIGKLKGWDTDILTHKGNCKFCSQRNKCK